MKIAIVGTVKKPYFGQNLVYVDYLAKAGDVILLPPNPKADFILNTFDLLVLPGGGDVDQARYGGFNYHQGAPDVHSEYFDKNVLPSVLGKIPILGICRGMQSVCIELGCHMIQDLEAHPYSTQSRNELIHDVYQWLPNAKITGKKFGKTNSLHHQAVIPDGDIEVLCVSESYKDSKSWIPEIVCNKTMKFAGVQFHPEEFDDVEFFGTDKDNSWLSYLLGLINL